MTSIVFFYSGERKEGMYVPSHEHSCWELVLYGDGAGKTRIDGKNFYFGKHTFAVLPPHCPHDEHHSKTGTLAFIGFDDASLSLPAGIYKDDSELTVSRTVERILQEERNRYVDSGEMLALLMRELLLLLERVKQPAEQNLADISYAKKFIEENYNWKICFPELAKSCGYGFDLFRRKFKETYGISPKNYLMQLRLDKAHALLQKGEMSCTQVAYECGFSDSAQFSTMYRNRFGISPSKQTRV